MPLLLYSGISYATPAAVVGASPLTLQAGSSHKEGSQNDKRQSTLAQTALPLKVTDLDFTWILCNSWPSTTNTHIAEQENKGK